jgi:three-Cys-motif partner protein
MVKEVTWELDLHTKAKHDILKGYLQAWYPILNSTNKRIVYIDGFAGPGEYNGGEPGSPIIALKTAKNHSSELKSEIVFWFIEENKDRCCHLESIIKKEELPTNFLVHVECGRFDERLTSTLADIENQGKHLAPTFVFIDPFGISDTPFSVVDKILKNKKCEVFINFMSGFLNRFGDLDLNKGHINDLFGTDAWQTEATRSEEGFVEYYQQRLGIIAKYVRSFTMKNENNQTIYRLIFGTNSYEGLKKMKEAMWRVDKTGSFTFSDRTDPKQVLLIPHEPNYSDLKRLIVNKFNGLEAGIDDVERYVVIKTIYLETHFKKQILTKMEKCNPPEIIVSRPGKSGFPPNTKIKFLSYDERKLLKIGQEDCNRQRTLFEF